MFETENVTVFVEAHDGGGSAPASEELFIETDDGKAPFKNGAVLHVARKQGQRLTFSVLTAAGKRLCSWQPTVLALREHYPGPVRDYLTLDPVARRSFQRMGEPIVLVGSGLNVRETDEFRIDGKLASTSGCVFESRKLNAVS
ncbi:MAG: hypothetical protein LAP38_09515 [Acidobacteriia bacterium]|nr:hypothetical protein [Terriglobia bacterium]